MTKITCDRCGKEIVQSTSIEFPTLLITAQEGSGVKPHIIDLCSNCRRKFYQWLKCYCY